MQRYGNLPMIGLAVALLGAAVFTTIADRSTGMKLLSETDEARRTGNFKLAEENAERAIKYIREQYGEPSARLADALDCRGAVYEDEQRYREAEGDYIHAKLIREQALPPNHPDIVRSIHRLGAFYVARPNYQEAESNLQRALDMASKTPPEKQTSGNPVADALISLRGPADPEEAAVLSDLGWLYSKQGQYDKARSCYRKSVELRLKTLGPNNALVRKGQEDLRLLQSFDSQK